jgi:transcription elongation factor GreA
MPNNFLTKEGYQKLQDELDYLRTAKRQEVANRLHEAMEGGELIENAEYEAAKNEQAFVEGRIQELEVLLATAKIIEENGKKKSDIVQIGSKVTIKEGNFEPETFIIVGVAEANPREGKISNAEGCLNAGAYIYPARLLRSAGFLFLIPLPGGRKSITFPSLPPAWHTSYSVKGEPGHDRIQLT